MSFRTDLESGVRGAVCQYLGGVARYVDEPFPNADSPFGLAVDAAGSLIAGAISGAGRLFCDSAPFPISSRPQNGRCSGSFYRVDADATCFFSGTNLTYKAKYSTVFPSPGGIPGPIGDLVRPFIEVGGNFFLGPPMTISAGSPATTFEIRADSNDQGDRTDWRFGNNKVLDARITNITVVSGPDNCSGGGIAPIYPTPGERQFPIVIGGNSGIIQIGAGNIAINGDVTIPVNVTFPDVTINLDVDLFSGEINIRLPGFELPGFPGLPDAPGYPPIEPPYNTNGLMVGAIVTTTAVDQNLIRSNVILQGDNPDVYGPRLGSINFYVVTPRGKAWTKDFDIKNRKQYVPCGTNFGAVDVKGTPDSGVTWTITPVYATSGPNEVVFSG